MTDGGQLENWEKFQFPSILYSQTANKGQITVLMRNAWNIQSFTISLLTFDQFWWNFTWQGIFAFTSWCRTNSLKILKSSRKLRKISIFFYSLPQNSGKSAINRFHAKLVKYSNFYDIFADVWPILMKFHVARHKLMSDQKFDNFKIQVDRWGQLKNWEKFQFPSILYPKTANKVQITVFMPK